MFAGLFARRWRARRRKRSKAQALVEFALVLMLIITTMVGGVLTIQALFLQQRLIDIVARAAQWGGMTNSNEEMNKILDEARTFSSDVTVRFDPVDPRRRVIGSTLTVEVTARIPLVGAGVALEANLGARSVIIIEHAPMRFAVPAPPPFTFKVGDFVRIQTTANESLNVRRAPGLKGGVIWSLFQGNLAFIVDGPVTVDGLRWWKVERRQRGGQVLVGWCVDRADTVDTLVLVTKSF
jgi:hypothetical protein